MENRQAGIDFEEEREIDLKQLFLVLCAKWKLILIAALIGAILGGIYGAVNRGTITAVVPADETTAEAEAPTVGEWEVYEMQKKLYEDRIAQNMRLMEAQKDYLENSPRMTINFRDVSVASAVLYVTRGEDAQFRQADPAGLSITTQRILYAYVNALYDASVLEGVAKKIDTEAVYVRELISAGVDEKRACVSFSSTAADDATAEAILEELVKAAEAARGDIASTYDSHEMSVTRLSTYSGINNTIRDAQNEAVKQADTYNNQIIADKTALSKLEEPKEEKPAETTDTDVASVTTTIPAPLSARNVIKNALLGCVAGIFLSALALVMYYIFSGRMLSAEEMNRRYGLRALTVLPASPLQGLDLKLARAGRDGAYYRMSSEELLEVAVANLSVYAPEVKELLLVGSGDAAQLERVKGALSGRIDGVSLACAPDINENADSLQALKSHEHIILVEEILKSRYEEIDRELKTLLDWKKNIVGSIVTG